MEIISSCKQIQDRCLEARSQGKILGLVPTMGFFHEGHLSLMRWARDHCNMLAVSLFVNPAQFGPGEDYQCYPRNWEKDMKIAREMGVDLLFAPSAGELYPPDYATWVEVSGLSEKLCGRSRPTHFRGVTTVVCKLFNLLCPHLAVFGQKDWQQFVIIHRMVLDLHLPVQVVSRPIVREEDGLAMSSRNAYLEPEERRVAPYVYQGLLKVRDEFQAGESDRQKLESLLKRYYRDNLPQGELEYAQIVDAYTLEPGDQVYPGSVVAVAMRLGQARLIDNILL